MGSNLFSSIRGLISVISSEENGKEEDIYYFETYLQEKCGSNSLGGGET